MNSSPHNDRTDTSHPETNWVDDDDNINAAVTPTQPIKNLRLKTVKLWRW
ncbi:MAG: hypothetical protein HC763_09070 [Hydrococcus sp. CRU_1_1]|nr:hypothetical protein [Hydrococcus sp. CRU_1_1]NJQ97513.1 hypothetical protein [Hydrococcus sp. CSU_1_8]